MDVAGNFKFKKIILKIMRSSNAKRGSWETGRRDREYGPDEKEEWSVEIIRKMGII
jgi:hypothetical protein